MDPSTPIEETMSCLKELISEGNNAHSLNIIDRDEVHCIYMDCVNTTSRII